MPAAPAARPVRALLVLLLAVAALVGPGLVPQAADAATRSRTPAASALRYAMHQMGDPYRWAAVGPNAFDCSGLTMRAYGFAGVTIPRTSRQQWSSGPKIARNDWKPGDLVFWASDRSRPSTSIYHVGLYVGGGQVLHAPRTGKPVQISPLWTSDLMAKAVRPAGARSKQLLTVRRGMHGDAVSDVQRRLRANGYAVRMTGTFGAGTEKAVVAFQQSLGYRGHGVVGSATWSLLVQRGVMTRVV